MSRALKLDENEEKLNEREATIKTQEESLVVKTLT